MYERATGAPRWEWISIKAGPKQSCAPQTGMGRSDRRHGRSDLDAHTLATPIPALRPRPKQALPEPPRHCTSWSRLAQTLSLAGHGLPLFHETVLSRCRPSELRAGVLLACLQPSVAITLMGVASASHSCCDHEGPSPLGAAAVPRRPNLHWPKASAPTRGRWQLGLLPHDGAVQGRSLARMAHDCYLDRARKVLLPESPAKRG